MLSRWPRRGREKSLLLPASTLFAGRPKNLCTESVSLSPVAKFVSLEAAVARCGQHLCHGTQNARLSWLLPAPVPRSVPADFTMLVYGSNILSSFRSAGLCLHKHTGPFRVRTGTHSEHSDNAADGQTKNAACSNAFVVHDSQLGLNYLTASCASMRVSTML